MKKIIKLLSIFCFIISLCLSILIFKNSRFDFSKYNRFLNSFYSYLNLSLKKDESVSTFNKYISIGNNKYKNDSFIVYSFYKGVVMIANKDSLIIKYDNGYIGYYDNLINVRVSKYDVINKDCYLANFIDYFTFTLQKGDTFYNYEEVFKND